MTQSNHTVTLTPSGRQFHCDPDRTILECGLSAGLALPYRCANGSCGVCLGRVIEGEVKAVRFHDYTLSAAEKIAGTTLMCSCVPLTDVVIEVAEATSVKDMPCQTLTAKLCRHESFTGLMVVAFKFTRGNALRFLPGQRAQLSLSAKESVELPIASCPCNAQFVEFHIPTGGAEAADTKWVTGLSSRSRVTVTGPSGCFTLSDHAQLAKLFIAIGEGFASIQGLMEHVMNLELDVPCCLLWLATQDIGHYRHNLCRSWADAFDTITYAPVDASDDALSTIDEVWGDHFVDCEVYLSGPDVLAATLSERLQSVGVHPDRLYLNNV